MIAQELKRLGRNMLIYGGGDALVRFISFFLLPLFTRYLTPEDYGLRGLLLAMTAVLAPVFSLGLSAAIGPCYFEGNSLQRKAETIWTASLLLLASAGVMLVAGTFFASTICQWMFGSVKYTGLWHLSLWTVALTIFSEPFNMYLRFEEKAHFVVVTSVTSALVTIGASFVLVVYFREGVRGLVLGALAGRLVMLAMQVGPALRHLPLRWARSLVRALLVMGIPLIPAFAWLYIIQQAGKYLLQWRWGMAAVGLYQVGLSVSSFSFLAVSAFQSAWYPFFMSFMDRPEEVGPVFSRIMTFYVFGACLIAVGFFSFAKPVLEAMTQPSFHMAWRVVGFTASAALAQGLFFILLPPMYFAREVQAVSLIQGVVAILALLANYVFIRIWGGMGAAIALFIGFALFTPATLLWNWFRRARYVQIPYERRRPGYALLVTALLALLSLTKPSLDFWGEWAFAVCCLLAISTFIWRLLQGQEKAQLLSIVANTLHLGPMGRR